MIGLIAAAAALISPPQMLPDFAVGEDDYPPAALRANQNGRVGFAVDVDANGVPSNCLVTISSSFPLLDERTCTIVMARMRFSPARDQRDRAVSSTYQSRIRWLISPERKQQPFGATLTTIGTFDPHGLVDGCTTVGTGKWQKYAEGGSFFKCTAHFLKVFELSVTEPRVRFSSAVLTETHVNGTAPPAVPPQTGELLATLISRFSFAADGTVASCSTTASGKAVAAAYDPCAAITASEPVLDDDKADAKRQAWSAVTISGIRRPGEAGGRTGDGAVASPPQLLTAMTIFQEDYPPSALRHDQEGAAGIELLVSRAGLPERCRVTVSSSFDILDERSCALAIARMRFTPARGISGSPIRGIYRTNIRWQISPG